MKIVVLDGYTTNSGDLSWGELESLGDCAVYDRTCPDDIIKRSLGADAVVTNKTVLTKEIIEQLPGLKYIGLLSTGVNAVDLSVASGRGITVTNVPAYSTASVVQMVFAHLLNFTQRVAVHADGVRSGRWVESKDFCYWDYPLTELAGKVFGIVGYGQIGRSVARVAGSFGMKAVVNIRQGDSVPEHGVRFVGLDELLSESDVVSLHCPLTSGTERLINAERIALMKKTAFLINTGRGGLVDEQALADALNGERIAGAGLDVLSSEPPRKDNPLLMAKNCTITPHIAWATKSARERLIHAVAENLKAFLSGVPRNVADGCAGVWGKR